MADEETRRCGKPTTSDIGIECFLQWCLENDLILCSKVRIGTMGSCHRYGMVATDNISKGETMFEIPRSLLLSPTNCSIAHLLEHVEEEGLSNKNGRSGWVPLLVALMYEYTNPVSFWKPYLSLVPSVQVLDQPMFWTADERQSLLSETGIEKDVESDLDHIEEEFSSVVLPFLKAHKEYFKEEVHNLTLYKHMVGFVMAYSFTEEAAGHEDQTMPDIVPHGDQPVPVMVPMADILNHHSCNNAHLQFGVQSLRMVATEHITKGQEVFNTYGKLGSGQLLQSYGFVEETPNPYDMVDIPVHTFRKTVMCNVTLKDQLLYEAKFQLMEEAGIATTNDVFQFSKDGCSQYGPDISVFLKILHLTADKLYQLLNELSRPSTDLSEEFDDIRDAIYDVIDFSHTWRIVQKIFCDNAKPSHIRKRKECSDNKNDIANKVCKNLSTKRTRTTNENTRNRAALHGSDWEGNSDCVGVTVVGTEGKNTIETGFCLPNGNSVQTNIGVDCRHGKEEAAKEKKEETEHEEEKEETEEEETEEKVECLSKSHGGFQEKKQRKNPIKGKVYVDMSEEGDEVDGEESDHSDLSDEVEEGGDEEEEVKETEDEEEDEEEEKEEDQIITYERIAAFPEKWRETLASTARISLHEKFGNELRVDFVSNHKWNRREKAVQRIKMALKSLLQKISLCNSE